MIIRLAFFEIAALPENLTELLDALPFGENDRARLRSIKNDTALRHSLAARMALRSLCQSVGAIARTEHGKPYFSEDGAPCFSLSHAGGLAVAACSNEPCGVDLECSRGSLREDAVARRFFSDAEVTALHRHGDFLALWTKKEAIAKCLGKPLPELLGKEIALPTRTYREGSFTVSLAAEHEFSVEFLTKSIPFQEVLL